MSDNDNDKTNKPANLAEHIIENGGDLTASAIQDAITAMAQGRSDAPYLEPERGRLNARVETETADAGLTDDDLDALALEAATRSPDNDFSGEVRVLNARTEKLRERLDAVTYDQTTGEPIPVLQGKERAAAMAEARQIGRQARISAAASLHAAAIKAERLAMRDRETHEKALRHAWHGNDPTRKEALDRALLDIEARTLAEKIHALRNGA